MLFLRFDLFWFYPLPLLDDGFWGILMDGMHMLSQNFLWFLAWFQPGSSPAKHVLPGIGGHLGRCTAECAPMQVQPFWGIRFWGRKSWKNLLKMERWSWEFLHPFSWVSRKFRLGQKYGTGITRALVFNISRTLLWSNTYFPVTSANPRQGSGEEKPAHSGNGGKTCLLH